VPLQDNEENYGTTRETTDKKTQVIEDSICMLGDSEKQAGMRS